MASRTQIRLQQITGSIGNAAGKIRTDIAASTLATVKATDITGSLGVIASAIGRIHGKSSNEAFGNATGTFYATLKSDSTGNVDIGSTTDADKFGDIFVGDGKGLQIGAAEEHKIIDADPGLTINSSEAISIGNAANAQAINIGTGGAARTITVGNVTGATALDVNVGTGGVTVDTQAGGGISLDAVGAASNFTLTSDGDAEDLTIALAGATNSSLVLSSTGTAADALQITTTAGGIDITNGGATGEDLDITASNASINITAAEADADAIKINASAGGINIDSADMIDIDAADEITIDTTSADGHIAITSAHTAGDSIVISANADAGAILDIDAGIMDVDVQGTYSLDATGVSIDSDAASNLTTSSGALTITSAAAATWSTAAGALTIDGAGGLTLDSDGTDAVNLGTEDVAKTITIGADASTKVDVNALEIELDAATGVTIDSAGTAADAIDINSAGGLDVDVADEISLTTTSADGHISLVSAHTSGVALHIDADADAGSIVDIDAGILTIDSTGTATHTVGGAFLVNCASTVGIQGEGTISIGTADSATAVNIGHGTSEVTIGDNLTVTGDFIVKGTTTTVSSSNVVVKDPIMALGVASSSIAGGDYTLGAAGDRGFVFGMDGAHAGSPVFFWDHSSISSGEPQGYFTVATSVTSGSTASITVADHLPLKAESFYIDGTSDYIDLNSGDLRLVSAGDIVLDPAGTNVLPGSDSADSLGASDTAWANLYVDAIDLNGQGSISMGGTGRIDLDADDDTSIRASADDVITFEASGADQIAIGDGYIAPSTTDDISLGTTLLNFSDLFLDSGAVINFNSDVTLTHSANTITVAGGTTATAALTTSTIVASGIIKTDDTTDATSKTDGSLQTDGGLSVAKAIYNGTAATLAADSGVVTIGSATAATFSAAGLLNINNETEATSTTNGSLQTDGGLSVVKSAVIGDDLDLLSNGAILNIGDDQKFTVTHANASNTATVTADHRLAFGNAGEYITGDNTDLNIVSSNNIALNADGGDITFEDGASTIGKLSNPGDGIGFALSASAGNMLTLDSNMGSFQFTKGAAHGGTDGVIFDLGAGSLHIVNMDFDPATGDKGFKFNHSDTYGSQFMEISGSMRFLEPSKGGEYVELKTAAIGGSGNVSLTLPGAVPGANDDILVGTTGGVLSFKSASTLGLAGTPTKAIKILTAGVGKGSEVAFNTVDAGSAITDFSVLEAQGATLDVFVNGQLLVSGSSTQSGNGTRDYNIHDANGLKFAFDLEIDDVIQVIKR